MNKLTQRQLKRLPMNKEIYYNKSVEYYTESVRWRRRLLICTNAPPPVN